MDLVNVGWGYVNWIGLAQDRDRWRALVNFIISNGVCFNIKNVLGISSLPKLLL
jgi:hypothetical protein